MSFNVNEIDLSVLVGNTPDQIFYLGMDRKLLFFNTGGKRFLMMMGCLDPRPGDDVLASFPENKQNVFYTQLDKLQKGEVYSFDDHFKDKQDDFYCDISLYALTGVTGEATGFCILVRNTTERRKAEEKYRRLFHDHPMVMYVVRLKDLGVLDANEAAVRQYGYTREEFLQKTALDWRLPEDRDKLKSYLLNIEAEGQDGPAGIWRHVLANGQHIFMQVWLHLIRYNGEDAVMAMAQNVTDTLELERKLEDERNAREQHLTEAIIEAQKKERREIGMELHDNVNQILGSAKLYLSVAQQSRGPAKNKLIQKASDYIMDAIEEMRKLCKNLVSPSQNFLALETAINCLAEDLTLAHNLSIHTDLSGFESGSLDDKFKLNIYRIVQEQLNNIVKHANASNIKIELSSTHGAIRILITDDGTGFDTSVQKKGIGLSNIQIRTDIYNGRMEVVSCPGQGCSLMINFPEKVEIV